MTANIIRKRLRIGVLNDNNLAVSILFFLLGLSFATWTSQIATIQQKLNLSDGALGSILFAMPVGLWVSLLFCGWLIKRYSSKQIAVLGLILYNIILLSVSLCSNTIQLTICLFLSGLCYSAVNVSMNMQGTIAQQIPQKNLLTFFHGVWSVAGFIGAFVATLFIRYQISILIHFSVISFFGVLTILSFKKHLYYNPELETVGKTFAVPEKSMIILGGLAFFAMICESTMYDWSVVYFKKEVQNAKDNIGIGYSAFMAMMTIGRFGNSFLLGKYGIRNLILVNACLISSGILISITYSNLIESSIGFGLVGLGISSMVPLVVGAASKTKRMAPASGIASVLTMGFAGFLISSPLIGIISEHFSLKVAFALLILISIFIGALSRFLKR